MFDEQPDCDLHGECAAEIHRLEAERDELLAALREIRNLSRTTSAEVYAMAFDALARCTPQTPAAPTLPPNL